MLTPSSARAAGIPAAKVPIKNSIANDTFPIKTSLHIGNRMVRRRFYHK
jgi:hypothetical protein